MKRNLIESILLRESSYEEAMSASNELGSQLEKAINDFIHQNESDIRALVSQGIANDMIADALTQAEESIW